jgi:hypothetical protein
MSSPPDNEDPSSKSDGIVQHVKKMLDRLLDRLPGGKPDQGSVAEPAVERKGEEDGA